jgi:hypothetical protein
MIYPKRPAWQKSNEPSHGPLVPLLDQNIVLVDESKGNLRPLDRVVDNDASSNARQRSTSTITTLKRLPVSAVISANKA